MSIKTHWMISLLYKKKFLIYLNLRFEKELLPQKSLQSELKNCHIWFGDAVARWLDLSLYRAMERIAKAVNVDKLEPVDDLVKHRFSICYFCANQDCIFYLIALLLLILKQFLSKSRPFGKNLIGLRLKMLSHFCPNFWM